MQIQMNKKYRTRDRRNVRILCVDGPDPDYPIVGCVDDSESVFTWIRDGSFCLSGEEDELDLIEHNHYADIPIDTPGWARTRGGAWFRRHFAGVGHDGLPMAWDVGWTSHTADGKKHTWHEFVTVKPDDAA